MRGPRYADQKITTILQEAENAIDDAIELDVPEEGQQQIVYAKLPEQLTEKLWETKIQPLYTSQWDTVEKVWKEEEHTYYARLTYVPKIPL